MTRNQIAYQELKERRRANQAAESEAHRSNVVREDETHRSNLARENIDALNYLEASRSNVARETETNRSNLAKEFETHRSNVAHETETRRHNVVSETTEQVKAAETQRSNKAKEAETERHNRNTEYYNAHQFVDIKDWGDLIPFLVSDAVGAEMTDKPMATVQVAKSAYKVGQKVASVVGNAANTAMNYVSSALGIDMPKTTIGAFTTEPGLKIASVVTKPVKSILDLINGPGTTIKLFN